MYISYKFIYNLYIFFLLLAESLVNLMQKNWNQIKEMKFLDIQNEDIYFKRK